MSSLLVAIQGPYRTHGLQPLLTVASLRYFILDLYLLLILKADLRNRQFECSEPTYSQHCGRA